MFLGFLLGCFSFLACGTLASQPEIEPTALCTGRQSLDHWTARQVSGTILYTPVFPLCWNTQSVIYSDITTPPLCCQAFPPERSMEPGPLSVPACRPWAPQLCHKENATRGQSDTYSATFWCGHVVQWLCCIILNSSEMKKVRSQWIKDFNVRPKTIRLVEENKQRNFLTLVLAVMFRSWDQKQKPQNQNQTNGTASSQKASRQKRKQSTEWWEKILASHLSDKGLISKILKGLLQPKRKNSIKFKKLLKKWTNDLSRH